jgi:hypothetical protein
MSDASYVIDLRDEPSRVKVSDLIIGALAEDVDARLLAPSFLRCHAEDLELIAGQVQALDAFSARLRSGGPALLPFEREALTSRIDRIETWLRRAAERCRCVSELHYRIENGALDRALGEGAEDGEEDRPSDVRAVEPRSPEGRAAPGPSVAGGARPSGGA